MVRFRAPLHYKLYDSIDFENLTGKFGLKHQVIIILKELSLKADELNFQLAKIGRKEMSSTRLRKLKKSFCFKCL